MLTRLARPVRLLALALIGAWLVSCSGMGAPSNNSVVASPTPDPVTTKYVALVHNYWSNYVTARGNGATVCYDKRYVDLLMCRQVAVAILAVHQQFLKDLVVTPPPPKFAADDQAFRSQLPKAIFAVKAMISAADSKDKAAVLRTTGDYVNAMIPIVTDALNHVDPSVIHD